MCKFVLNILIVFLFIQISCKKEKEEVYDPIVIYSELTHVSKYGGNDGAIYLSITGGLSPYKYKWSNNEATKDIVDLTAGTYIVIVTDSRNEFKSDTFIITQPSRESLLLTLTKQDVTEYGGDDGSISASVSGGAKPYQYNWSNGSNNKEITGLISGMYYITVIDAMYSTIIDSAFISQPEKYEIVIKYQATPPSETGANDGTISTTIKGGYPPYEYNWSNGSDAEDIENLQAGEYTLTVTDSRSQMTVETIFLSDSLIDIDNNTYAVVIIGDQTWMKANLKVTHDSDGNSIASYAYNDEISNVEIYGRLYTWDVAMNGDILDGAQGICPCGWHIPSDEEFKELEMFLGMTQEEADMVNVWRGEDVGTSLKKGGDSGYDAQLSGRRSSAGDYSLIKSFEYIWTSTEYEDKTDNAWRRCLDIHSDEVGRWNTFPKDYAFSVRCIKNE